MNSFSVAVDLKSGVNVVAPTASNPDKDCPDLQLHVYNFTDETDRVYSNGYDFDLCRWLPLNVTDSNSSVLSMLKLIGNVEVV